MSVDTGDTKRTLVKAALDAPKEFARALREVAQAIRLDSMKRTPVDTGTLRASHRVTKVVGSGTQMSTSIEVGGSAAGYAVYVHEGFGKHRVGERKFLENATNAAKPMLEQMLVDALQRTAQ